MRYIRVLINRLSLTAGISVLAALMLWGCKEPKFLEQPPLGQMTSDNFFQNADQAIWATNATYNQLRNWSVHVFAWLGMTDIASDDARKGSTPTDASFLLQLDDFSFDPGNIAFSTTWQGYFQGIYRANLAIENIPGIDMDSQLKARLIGENKFLRAYFYFFLVRAYGGVPLITQPLRPSEYIQARAPADSVYALIERDLQDAADVLPLKSEYASSNLGRATRGAAQGLLAKVYLFEGKYQDAYDQAQNVMTSMEYSLLDNYDKIFTREGENSSGSIFEVQATSLETGEGGTQYNQVQGVRGPTNLGWGFNDPTTNLETAFEPGDPRQEATILYVWEPIPGGEAVLDNTNINGEMYNQKSFIPRDQFLAGFNDGPGNIRRLRYSDILLMAAEAAYHLGNTGEAQSLVNQVRARARNGRAATLGITAEDLADTLKSALHMPNVPGVLARRVNANGPAAGLVQPFRWHWKAPPPAGGITVLDSIDIIQSVNGSDVTTRAEYLDAVNTVGAGGTATLDILRAVQTVNAQDSVVTSTQNVQENVTAADLLPDVTATGQALLDAIWHERRVELAMEQQRFFDLRREGRAADLLAGYQSPKNDLYPIPLSEIDLTGGVLEQNPDYGTGAAKGLLRLVQ